MNAITRNLAIQTYRAWSSSSTKLSYNQSSIIYNRFFSTTTDRSSLFPNPKDPSQHPLNEISSQQLATDETYWQSNQTKQKAIIYKQKLTPDGEAYAIGRRKSSRAQVWLSNGSGQIIINDVPWADYFTQIDQRDQILRPLSVVKMVGKMDIRCKVIGGGKSGQSQAIRLGVSRALQNWDPVLRPSLKSQGLLTRDSRVVESKKAGRKKARKSFQWVKR